MCTACQRQLTCNTVYSHWTIAKPWSTHTEALADVHAHLLALQSFKLRGGYFPPSPADRCPPLPPSSHLCFTGLIQFSPRWFKFSEDYRTAFIEQELVEGWRLVNSLSRMISLLSGWKKAAPEETKCVQLSVRLQTEGLGETPCLWKHQWIIPLSCCRIWDMQLLISCTRVVLSPMSIYPNPAHKLEQLFSLSKIKAPDTRSPLTWVILQPLTFPSLKQAQARALIDPADGLGANLPGTGRRWRYFTAQSDAITLKINTIWTAADLPTKEDGWAGGLFVHLHMPVYLHLFINQVDAPH